MIYLNIQVKVYPNKRIEFEHAVSSMLDNPLFKSKTHPCKINQNLIEKGIYTFQQEFDDLEDYKTHYQSNEYHSLIGAMKVLGEILDAKIIYPNKEENLIIN